MTHEAVVRAAVVFLDQFIGRGAHEDVLKARELLASDRSTQSTLTAALAGDAPSERDAFDALRSFLADRARPETLDRLHPHLHELTHWMAWDSHPSTDPQTIDPAQWHDWLDAVAATTQRPTRRVEIRHTALGVR